MADGLERHWDFGGGMLMEENHGPYFRTAARAAAGGANDQTTGRREGETGGRSAAPVCWSGAV